MTGSELDVVVVPIPRARGELVPDDDGGADTAADLVDGWLVATTFNSGNTKDAYSRDINEWLAFCASIGVDPLLACRGDVDAYILALAQLPNPRTHRLLAPASQARKLSVVSSFYQFLEEQGAVETVPVRRRGRPKAPKDSTTIGLSAAESVALMARLELESTTERAIVLTLLLQGLRVSELTGLTVADLRRNAGHPTMLVHGKGGKVREIAMDGRVDTALTGLLAARFGADRDQWPGDVLVVVTAAGGRWDRKQVFRSVKRIARAAGIVSWLRLSPHSLRHTCATQMLDAGVPIHNVQFFLGHASADTTARYDRARSSLERSTAAVAARAELLAAVV